MNQKKQICFNCKELKEAKYIIVAANSSQIDEGVPVCSDYCRENFLGNFDNKPKLKKSSMWSERLWFVGCPECNETNELGDIFPCTHEMNCEKCDAKFIGEYEVK